MALGRHLANANEMLSPHSASVPHPQQQVAAVAQRVGIDHLVRPRVVVDGLDRACVRVIQFERRNASERAVELRVGVVVIVRVEPNAARRQCGGFDRPSRRNVLKSAAARRVESGVDRQPQAAAIVVVDPLRANIERHGIALDVRNGRIPRFGADRYHALAPDYLLKIE